MQRRWKQVLCSLLGVLLLAGSLLTVPVAAAETTAPQTTAAESTDDAKDSGNTRQIVQTLVIFTVACGVTAFLVMRPSLKKLKAAKEQAASDGNSADKTK